MGFFDNFVSRKPENESPSDVTAALSPVNDLQTFINPFSTLTYNSAMTVPSVARARNIICSTVAGLPIEQYNKLTGAHVEPLRVINQPDPRVPGSYVYSWLSSDLLFHGIGYGQVMDLYADGRISAWTRIAPERVTPQYNANATEIVGYQIDGIKMPLSGRNSVIVFYGLDEGVLARAGRTILAAMALEKAAKNFADEPVPTMALKSNGTNLTSERISRLLSSWNQSRRQRGTAFLNADVDLQVLGIDPAKLQLNEARQYVALEIARAMGIPAYFLSAETTSMTYSNATNERKALIDFGIKNIIVPIEQRLSMPDFVSSTIENRFSLDEFLRGSALERAQVYEILNRVGAMSVEQIQEEEDLIK